MSDQPEKSKLFVDEDWKTKVEAEREAARKKTETEASASATPPAESSTSPAAAPASTAPEKPAADDPLAAVKLPPASLGTLVEMLASQVTVHLGFYPDPVQKKPVVRLNLARHYIDTLALLEQKTKGNVTPEEQQMFEQVLHDLRLMFVQAKKM